MFVLEETNPFYRRMDKGMQGYRQMFGRGEVVVAEGTQGDRTFVILRGEVLVCKRNMDGKQVPLARLGPGDMFGEMYLFDQQGRRTATAIISSEDGAELEVLFKEDMEAQMARLSPHMKKMFNGCQSRLKLTTHLYADTATGRQAVELPDGTLKVIERNLHRPQ